MKVIVRNFPAKPSLGWGLNFLLTMKKEIESPHHLRILNACRHLEAVEIKPKAKKKAKKMKVTVIKNIDPDYSDKARKSDKNGG